MAERQITPIRPVYPSPAGLVTCQAIGDHDLFVEDVLAVHVAEDCLEGNRIRTDRLDAFCFINWEYRAGGDRIERTGYTRS